MNDDQPKPPPATRVEVDLNIRANGNQARVGFEDADGPLQAGQVVEVYESESGLTGIGTVTQINPTQKLAWIAVNWPGLAEPAPECRSPLGCDKVVPCDPGCAVSSRYIAEQLAAANARAHNAKAILGTPAAHQPRTFPDVQGRCPACGWTSLFLADGGYITCSRLECPQPDAAATLLERDVRNDPRPADTANPAEPPVAALHLTYRLPRGV